MPAVDLQATDHISPFERIKHTDEAAEYWSALAAARLRRKTGSAASRS